MNERNFSNSSQREALTFRPPNTPEVVAKSASDLVKGGIYVSPDFIERQWGAEEANSYREMMRSNGSNKSGSAK